MKKVFLTLMMFLFAFTGVMRAQTLTVHDGTDSNGYVPVYGFYADAYLKCEMVYPAAELSDMSGGMINSMTFYATQASVSWGTNFQVFLAEVEDETISAFAGPGTVVFEGNLGVADNQMVVTFTTPYQYNGGNLLVGVYQTNTGSYVTSTWLGEAVTGASVQGYNYSSLAAISPSQRNFLPKTTFEYVAGGAAAITTNPATLDLGYRPNGAWMAPFKFNVVNNGGAINVTEFNFNDDYFTANAELPAAVFSGNPLEVELTTGTADAGVVTSDFVMLYDGGRGFETFTATATAYDPVDGDVYESAIPVVPADFQEATPFQLPEILYKNYNLPVATDATDAVFTFTLDQDALVFAGVEGANPSIYLYREGFEGFGGPDAENNYEYTGPEVNPGPTALWFSYDYTGTNTWYGTSAGGGFYFGYQISADVIAENNLTGLSITTVETAAREAYPYECYILEGGDNPGEASLLSYGINENTTALYFFDINLQTPAVIGTQTIWVIFYSDSPYAAYCGRTPVDAVNGKIWTYNPNSTSPIWGSNTAYTPCIYARMLELPTGREVTMNLANMTMKSGNGTYSSVGEADGGVKNVAKAQMRRGRETQTLIQEGFEDGLGGWTMANCHGSSGPSTSYTAHGGTGVFRFYYTTTTPQYLISPVLTDNNGGSMSFYYARYSGNYPETFQVGYSTTTNDPSAFTFGSEVTCTNMYTSEYLEYSYNFPAGTKYVAIACTSYDQFYLFIDDITVTADVTAGGGDEPGGDEPGGDTPTHEPYICDFTAQINGMYAEAGTYYMVVATDVVQAQGNLAFDYVPLPEQAYIISPSDGETNVTAPYYAEWILGDYTTEMQVLVGTQYPPETVLIDWTDQLVESAFITDLLPNQSYFMQVNARNAAGETQSEIVAFTTPIDGVEGFAVENDKLYPGDAAVFTWTANRTHKGYNLYKDGVKVNETLITTNEYAVEDLDYNMAGYAFTLTAVYDAGESLPTDQIIVQMTGTGTVSGHVYDTDEDHPVANIPVTFIILDEYQVSQVFDEYVTTDENGFYTAEVLTGMVIPGIVQETGETYGYAPAIYTNYFVNVENQVVYEDIDIITHEYYYPLSQITATLQEEENNVLVEWSWDPAELIIDFETGDFSQFEFTLPAQYPWAVTTTNPNGGSYCMKSTCEGVASGSSVIEATVDVPFDAKMGFYVRVSSESNYDKFHFYIDGIEQGSALSGQLAYQYKEYNVSAGTHTYKWEYAKDSSVNSNDDCVYVDDITMYRKDEPVPPVPGATVYNFDDSSMMGWTSIDADNDGNGWVSSANPGIYHNSGVNLSGTGHNSSEAYVISGSYANQTGQALTPDNYLVSPTQISVQDGAYITFYACAQDASYAAEHFGVAVSTSTATAANFTTIQEWTLTAKGPQGRTAEAERDIRGTRDQGQWYEKTVDLSQYAGQDIWVAIRHFNCTDMFILNVDDITVNDGSAKGVTRSDDRSLVSYILYRRDIQHGEDDADIVTVASGISADVYEYIDNDWANLPYGEYQWGIQASYEGYVGEGKGRDEVTCDFESGLPTGWTVIDDNNDGYTWCLTSEIPSTWTYYASVSLDWYHNGSNAICSGSYINGVGALNPDEYLVSPQVNLGAGSSISLWAAATDASYPADHFGVFVSDNGTSNWTSVQEWTLSGKSSGTNGGRASRDGNGAKIGTWNQFTADLSAYSGAKYVAIRHFNCYDQYIMCVDDITITTSGSTPTPPPTPPTPPTPGTVGSGLSDILWSNMIPKDMEATLTFNVSLNNGQSAAGAAVVADGGDYTYNATVGQDGTAQLVVRKGVQYAISVSLEGYSTYSTNSLIEADRTFDVTLNEVIAPVENLYVSPTGWAMWEGGTQGGTPGPGPGPGPSGSNSFTEGFEGGLNGWTVLTVNAAGGEWLHSTENLGGYDYTELAHGGTGFAMCYSYVDYVGSFNTDSYLITPQKYDIVAGSTLTFWADNANDDYPENFSVCVATADNPTASDFTQVWTGGAKGTGNGNATVRHQNNRYENWRSHSIDLSAYAGQSVYIAFHDVNYDMYEIWIDDVELSAGSKGERAPMVYKVKLDNVYEGETTAPYFQHNVDGFEEGSTHVTAVRPIYFTGNGDWMEYEWTYSDCQNYAGVTGLTASATGTTANLSWTMPQGGTPGPNPPQPPTGGFTEGFESGMPTGWTVLDANNDGYTWCLTSDIPSTWTYYATMTLDWYRTGSNAICSGSYINGVGAISPNDYLITNQVTPTSGSTFSFYAAATDASYPADHFGVFVSTTTPTADAFTMLNEWTLTAKSSGENGGRASRDGKGAKLGSWHEYSVDLSAYAGQSIYIAIRHFNCNDQYIMCVDDIEFTTAGKGNRAMWDYVYHFSGTSAGQQAVATDGQYIYTASWQSAPTGGNTFYKYDLQGNFIEGFDITGATGIRDLTTDGEYFYGTSGGAQIFILDFTNQALVGTINCSGLTSRHISYDPERDGFWSGNWSTLDLYSRTGALLQSGPAPTSAYGSAYYKDADNVEHLYLFCQPNSDAKVYDYNITTGTLGTSPVFDFAATPGFNGIAGGCFIGSYDNKTCWFGNSQQDPNLVGIFELDSNGTGPTPPPTPPTGEGILGAYVFRDGELVSNVDPAQTNNSFTETLTEPGEYEYCVRVVYEDYSMSCPVCETVTIAMDCDPVTNFAAAYYWNLDEFGAHLTWTAPNTNVVGYDIYVDGTLYDANVAADVTFKDYEMPIGNYVFGIVAKYAYCESDMVTASVEVTGVDELNSHVVIYPNPTNGNVKIEAAGMNHITVVNTLGQVVYDADVDADMLQLNLGQFKAGLYMVRINTVNGVSVKRVTVVK